MLQCKPNSLSPDYVYKELFSLQISDRRAFFISENKLKFDSLFTTEYNKGNAKIDLTNLSSLKSSSYVIIQTNDDFKYYTTVGMTLLTYTTPIIDKWNLIDETKVINSIVCEKAEVRYKGRDWIAWYSTQIPFPYGPYKFSGLPGLIVKITDRTGDYDFELVRSIPSSKLKGKLVSVSGIYYKNAKITTSKDLIEAKENFKANAKHEFESMGTQFFNDQKEKPRKNETRKNGFNPIELED
ncbi:GLPGLI family protein [Halpernia frigidisoli]|uniref:GLPGLI family protein n=1 Tax=Halpernia frigidisoli TaxID=1125876 RepID=A0A1I3D5L6_9FLAO|nr:GLPGLI family protein [Halpernia frigidisoli]